MMFGKSRTCNFAAVPERGQPECNVVVLGVMGSGKSGLFRFFSAKLILKKYFEKKL